MFKKISEKNYRDEALKCYNYDGTLINCLNAIINSDMKIEKISIFDDSEVGFPNFDKTYSYSEFLNAYDKICYYINLGINNVHIILEDKSVIRIDNATKTLALFTKNIDFDLQNLEKKNENRYTR